MHRLDADRFKPAGASVVVLAVVAALFGAIFGDLFDFNCPSTLANLSFLRSLSRN